MKVKYCQTESESKDESLSKETKLTVPLSAAMIAASSNNISRTIQNGRHNNFFVFFYGF